MVEPGVASEIETVGYEVEKVPPAGCIAGVAAWVVPVGAAVCGTLPPPPPPQAIPEASKAAKKIEGNAEENFGIPRSRKRRIHSNKRKAQIKSAMAA